MARAAHSSKKSKHQRKKSHGGRTLDNAPRFMTRNAVLNHLQVKLPEFRRLCILKGIHPREPKKKFAGQNKTYYHVKDVKFLSREPLVEKSRELKAYEKKLKKARAKKYDDVAQRLDRLRPTYSLDHVVKERYPSFIDALRDMDDALTMLHLFATLPADNDHKIPPHRVHTAQRLKLEWQAFVTHTQALRKVFVSVKGIYYQAKVAGQDITWLTPHVLSQVLPDDVDFRVMLTFAELYETLVSFVNFKLYHSLGLGYPPTLGETLEQAKEALGQLTEKGATEGDKGGQEDTQSLKSGNLFVGLKVFLAREVPRESLVFVIRGFGGTVSWDTSGAPFEESDEEITHQIVDRPTQGHKFLSRDYVQPQWVYDCVNAGTLLPVDQYIYGMVPPPHLSPFAEEDPNSYVRGQAETTELLEPESLKSSQVLPIDDD